VRDIAEISDQNRENEEAVRLLLKAVRALPEADQDAVFGLLLQGLGGNSAWSAEALRRDERQRVTLAALGSLTIRSGARTASERASASESDAKVVPIRFPAQLYDELKAWCDEHGFPMAAVVRGLVERFLESQGLP
jgi:hypothetical protein